MHFLGGLLLVIVIFWLATRVAGPKAGLAVIDNIDTTKSNHGNAFAFGLDQASKFLDSFVAHIG